MARPGPGVRYSVDVTAAVHGAAAVLRQHEWDLKAGRKLGSDHGLIVEGKVRLSNLGAEWKDERRSPGEKNGTLVVPVDVGRHGADAVG